MASLYVTIPGARLELEAGRFLCVKDQHVLLSVPIERVNQVVIVGGCNVTMPAMAHMLDHEIDLIFLTSGGKFRGRLETAERGDVTRRRLQYERAAIDDFSLSIARAMVHGKLRNCRTRCMELDQGSGPVSTRAIEQLKWLMADARVAASHAELMGIEGRGTRWYFNSLREHLNPPWVFSSRKRQPPPDPVNALLSLAYTLLYEHCRSALLVAGLDPACGFLHRPRSGHASLASDLMEEFRPVIADTVVWTLLNKRMLAPSDFVTTEVDGVRLTPEGWRVFARKYNQRLETRIRIPERTTQTTYRKLLEIQARQLVRVIEGTQDAYTPFASR